MSPDRLQAWADLERRLAASRESLAPRWEDDPARARRILEERARTLAQPPSPPAWGNSIEALTFALGNETYALEARYLQAIFRLRQLSPIPGGTPPIFGVTAWRGDLLTILDLRQVLGVSARGLNDLSHVLVLGEAQGVFGVLADSVAELVTLPVSTIRPPAEGVAVRREYLRGITGEAVLVLDVAALLRLHG